MVRVHWGAGNATGDASPTDPKSTYVLLPVKVSIGKKEQVKAAIRKRAGELGITGGDPAVAAGEVVAYLLGLAP